MRRKMQCLLMFVLLWSSVAVAKAPLMTEASEQNVQPEPGKALVVFMRPSMMGGAVASSVYDAPDEGNRFLGVVRSKQKLAYQAEPGPHRFMVIAENADFLDATLEAGKTYYVLISPRPGMWKARFSLFPIHGDANKEYSVHSADFAKWIDKTRFIEPTDAAQAWYSENKPSIDEKKLAYLEKWNRMTPADREELTLAADDGIPTSH